MNLNTKVPSGPLEQKWKRYQSQCKLVSAANRRNYTIIVVGAGLAGSGTAAALGELGYTIKNFFFHDSPRRAHSVAAQGGVNAAKNYKNDGDNIRRMFVDTIRGGDFRSREANVYRMAELSVDLIDACVAQGVPFAREYGGCLGNRSFGGVQVERTFYAQGQTGQQLLLGAYSAMNRQVLAGRVQLFPRHEMLDLVVIDGAARGIITRNLSTGTIERHAAHAVVLATGGYSKIYYLSTLAMNCNATALWKAYKRGACLANPSMIQVHPTCLPPSGKRQSKLTLMSESLRNDGRIWVPKKPRDERAARAIPEEERDYYLERRYPAYGNLTPRDLASRAGQELIESGHGVGPLRNAVYLDFSRALTRVGRQELQRRYGNLFEMYLKITGENAYDNPMRIAPAAHFSMGGLWVDYELMTTVNGLFALGECNFADHGANRLGANSLLQASVDGYFIAPSVLGNYLATQPPTALPELDCVQFQFAHRAVEERIEKLLAVRGNKTVDDFHRQLGNLLWTGCGICRSAQGLNHAISAIADLRQEFWQQLLVPGASDHCNSELEKALRMADYLELGELMCRDALARDESCGAHFRVEHQTESGEALRDDQRFSHVAVWQHQPGETPKLRKEFLTFDAVRPTARSY